LGEGGNAEILTPVSGRYLDDPLMNVLIDDLRKQSPLAAAAWEDHMVVGREGGLRTFSHPVQGLLCFEQVAFNLSSRPEFKLMILVEAPTA
jgi:hypothetical protein